MKPKPPTREVRQPDAPPRADASGEAEPKDLRDSFASYLLTAGIQLGYVSQQLGHSNVATAATHYARWAGGNAYRSPMELEPGEVPADLLARLSDVNATSIAEDRGSAGRGNLSNFSGERVGPPGFEPGTIRL